MSTVDSKVDRSSEPLRDIWKNLVYLIFIVLVAGSLTHLLASGFDKYFRTQNIWLRTRFSEALNWLNQQDSSRHVYVWGASEIEGGLNPMELEKQICGRQSKKPWLYNLGFRDFNPFQMQLFLDHWRTSSTKPRLSIVKINPAHETETTAIRLQEGLDEVWEDIATPEEIFHSNYWTPAKKMYMFWAKFLLAGAAPGSLQASLLGDHIKYTRAPGAEIRTLLWVDARTHPYPSWNIDLQRFHDRTLGKNSSAEYVRMLKMRQSTEDELENNFQFQYKKSGINNPRFDIQLESEFIDWIERLKERSGQVVLLYTPEHPEARTRKTKKQYAAFLARIQRAVDLPILNFSEDPDFLSAEAYYDTHHFSDTGEVKFRAILEKIIRENFSPDQIKSLCENE